MPNRGVGTDPFPHPSPKTKLRFSASACQFTHSEVLGVMVNRGRVLDGGPGSLWVFPGTDGGGRDKHLSLVGQMQEDPLHLHRGIRKKDTFSLYLRTWNCTSW